jgi:hypothetical protein
MLDELPEKTIERWLKIEKLEIRKLKSDAKTQEFYNGTDRR